MEPAGGRRPLGDMDLIPSSKGRFEVLVDGELVYSKAASGRHAKPGEVVTAVRARIGPEIPR